MNPTITIALVEYIQLLHKGQLNKSLFTYFEAELKNCSAQEVNIAIENLIIRYKDVEAIENTVAKFIRAAASGLEAQPTPEFQESSVFSILEKENRVIESFLSHLKQNYIQILPDLRESRINARTQFRAELENLELIKKHYHKLQYGVFSALESVRAPTQCIQLMWHLEDSIWPQLKNCLDLLSGSQWDFNRFNKCYGKMFFLLGSLVFREDRILYPAAYQYLPEDRQKKLMLDAESYGIINEEGWRKKSDKTDRF